MEKLRSDEYIKKVIQKKEYIILYGAGGVGTVLTERLLREYPSMSLFLAVSAEDGYPYYLLGKKVYYIGELTDLADHCAVIIATLEKTQEEIARTLERLGFRDVYGMSDELYESRKFCWKEARQFHNQELIYHKRYVDPYLKTLLQICKDYQIAPKQAKQYAKKAMLDLNSDGLNLGRLVVTLGSKCSLRCKECDNLMPYFKPQKDLDLQKILSSLKILCAKADNILSCNLIGGEPFLSDNLYPVLEFLLQQENVYQITIGTNGMILPDKEQIPLLQNKKIRITISDYGKLVDKQRFVDYLEQYDICYEILGIERWIATGGVEKRGRSRQDLQSIYHNCYAGYYCKTLYEDKLFSCAKSSSLYALGFMKEQEYIEIKTGTITKEIKEFLLMSYSAACDYCGRTENLVYCEPAVQI